MTRAVVFAYHDVGVRALQALLDAGVQVALVVTHEDDAGEAVWWASVAALARRNGLPCIAPADPNTPAVLAACREADPDFLFSFYYRRMLGRELLALPRRGAFNLHGSLLPRYRGRAPVNWAILHGERETGVTLHVMDEKPDHGPIVDQEAVPIGDEDTARIVFDRLSAAAARLVARAVPALLEGRAVLRAQQHLPGQYFGGRRPEDGRIPPAAGARRIHDLVRAVAPPEYPGAFFDAGGRRVLLARTRIDSRPAAQPRGSFSMYVRDGAMWLDAADGGRLEVLAATLDGRALDPPLLVATFGREPFGPDPQPPHREPSSP